jgi:D-arginine dehydrogenase
VTGWPLVADYTHQLYFAPESRGLLASPMDEDPVEPCDAQPDELVIAQTMDRLERLAPSLLPSSLRQTWAGLRTFAPDQTFVIGEDPSVKGFFWLAGQGGSGIETSPVVGQLAAELLTAGHTDLIDAEPLTPARFTRN